MTEATLNPRALVGIVLIGAALLGLFVASILNVRSARGKLERRYLMIVTPLLWVIALSLLALMYALPSPWRYLVLATYLLGLPIFVYHTSLRRQMIRESESRSGKADDSTSSRA